MLQCLATTTRGTANSAYIAGASTSFNSEAETDALPIAIAASSAAVTTQSCMETWTLATQQWAIFRCSGGSFKQYSGDPSKIQGSFILVSADAAAGQWTLEVEPKISGASVAACANSGKPACNSPVVTQERHTCAALGWQAFKFCPEKGCP